MSDGYGPNAVLAREFDDGALSASAPAPAERHVLTDAEIADHSPELPEAATREQTLASPARTFAGLPVPTVILGALVLLMALWSLWLTRELLVLRSHKTVSVSLATIVHDFIAVEAHNGGTAETSAVRTQLYLAATQAAIHSLADEGQTVLVSEAVAGNSVPDVTPQLKAAINAKLQAAQIAAATAGAGSGH